MENNKTASEEMEELKKEVEKSIETLQNVAKERAVTIMMRTLVAACTSHLVGKATEAFLPKELKGVTKLGVAFGTFLIPELVGNMAADRVERILRETEEKEEE